MRTGSMMCRILLVLALVLTEACALGPFVVTHEEGHLPRFHVDLPVDECKFKVRKQGEEIKLQCKWEFE